MLNVKDKKTLRRVLFSVFITHYRDFSTNKRTIKVKPRQKNRFTRY